MSAKETIYKYCLYQPRCHKEVKNKLYELGCTTPEVDQYLAELIEVGLLNEEKFARAIARGKFRLKHWGRNKIVQQLKMQQVSAYCIKKGLSEIDPYEYEITLKRLAGKKWLELKGERNQLVRRQKVFRYMVQKGYEIDMVNDAINEILNANKLL